MKNLTPSKIVKELDRFIVGQDKAKRAVAIALRNRWRRQQVEEPLRDEIIPKNILMIGATGVGKTEIARRLSNLVGAPFIKVEATKFTEVGYVGRDVDQIIRDLVDISISNLKQKYRDETQKQANAAAEEKILEVLIGKDAGEETKNKFANMLREGILEDKEIEISIQDKSSNSSSFDIPGMPGSQIGMFDLSEIMNKALGVNKTKTVKMTIADARKVLTVEENDKLIDHDKVVRDAISNVEQNGIVFIDEIDKVCGKSTSRSGHDVSREGVQRDLLPLVEGCSVSTKYGTVKTTHILFIASGAFHVASPSDLLPELQGRLPIRVEMDSLTQMDFVRILNETDSSLILQYKELMKTEGIELEFTDDGIEKIAEVAFLVNQNIENIGARRLHTVIERLLDEISFNANCNPTKKYIINSKYAEEKVGSLVEKVDLSKFIL